MDFRLFNTEVGVDDVGEWVNVLLTDDNEGFKMIGFIAVFVAEARMFEVLFEGLTANFT